VALDCEMVGTEEDGSGAMCARVCVVDIDGSVLLSTYVAPDRPITDHRTELTGITPGSLEGAPSLREVRTAVLAVLNGSKSKDDDKSLLVGHDLPHDLECLGIKWPRRLCRDTAHHPPLQRHTHAPYKLRTLTLDHLGDAIQREGETHDPREDAWAAMRLYIGAAGLCAAHRGGESANGANGAFNRDEVLVCGDASERLNANGGTGRASTMPAPRFRCWCGDFTIGEVGTGAAAAAAAAPSPMRAKPASPSPMKSPLRDSTNAYASPTLTR
jgi:RNA exonuclease 4